MPRRLFVLRIPDGSIYYWGFLHPSIITRLRRNPPPLPTHPLVGMLAFIKQGLSLEQMDNSTAVDGSTHWGAWISLSFSTLLLLLTLPVTKWCCLGSRACFRFHCHIPTHFFSSSLFVHPHCLHLSSVSLPTYLPTTHLRACRSLCIRRRCSLSSPSQFFTTTETAISPPPPPLRLAQTYQTPLNPFESCSSLDRFSVSYHNLVAQAFFARATYTTPVPHLNSAIPAIVVEIKVT